MQVLKKDINTHIIEDRPAFVLHGCNCRGKMGAGVAKRLVSGWQAVKDADDRQMFSNQNEFNVSDYQTHRLGNFTSARINRHTTVINLYTQLDPGPNFHYCAFIAALDKFKAIYLSTPLLDYGVSMVPIGCGIGGANWYDVYRGIRYVFTAEQLASWTLVTNEDTTRLVNTMKEVETEINLKQ